MRFILDTDTISLYRRGPLSVRGRVNTTDTSQIAVTIISFDEQISGRLAQVHQTRSPSDTVLAYHLLQSAFEYFTQVPVLPFDETAALYFQNFQQQRIRVGTQDLRIAAIALANGCTVVTRNRRDFARVPGLALEDWTIPLN